MKNSVAPLALCLLLTSCGGAPNQPPDPSPYRGYQPISTAPDSFSRGIAPARTFTKRSALGIVESYIPRGRYGRKRIRRMNPRYITVHSTQNYSRSGNARAHAEMLRYGKLTGRRNSLGYVTWHYSVDQSSIYQSLPDNEQGQHADYEGPGNRYSIGIEMCENRGNSRSRTLDRTARLIALLMHEHRIPLSRVVPHQHWRMIRYSDGRDLGHKDCPNFLLTDGRPGSKWRSFLAKVNYYYRRS